MIELLHGDCLERLKELPDCSVDACVTDPPYGLSFMGKRWDYDVPSVEVWREVLRVLKPGGHLLAFAGTRTQHRMAVRIEDAGFEIRDMIAWVYGSGFPKSLDVSKAIDKRGGVIPWQKEFAQHLRDIRPKGLKVADINAYVSGGSKSNFYGHFIDTTCQPLLPTADQYRKLRELMPIGPKWDECFLAEAEREVVGQKTAGIANPDDKDRHTIGASAAVVVDITAPATDAAKQWQGWGTALKPALEPITLARKPLDGTVAANVLAHGCGAINVDGCRVATDDRLGGGHSASGQQMTGGWERPWMSDLEAVAANAERSRQAVQKAEALGRWPANLIHDGSDEPSELLGDAARFFYCAKASKADRGDGNAHPTVKPTELMTYLCRLVTPPGGVVLDPFMGSGSTGKAAVREGFRFIGIEREAEYLAIARERIKAPAAVQEDLFA